MSLTVEHLNADSTFLMTFAPSSAPSRNQAKSPGSFRILTDPWVIGSSTVFHPKFANTRLRIPPVVNSLAELKDDIDIIVVSQEKEDHLSRETLCSLPKDTSIRIVATSKAAKAIRRWKHFQSPDTIHALKPYDANRKDCVIRIPIEPYSPASAGGEVTIANVLEKGDLTGLHNAIGITYSPPVTLQSAPDGNLMKDNPESVLSVIYTPHGLKPVVLHPYISHHLSPLNHATPVTVLFHSLNTETNPWWLGGVILTGAPGGVKIAQDCRAKYWISAHDEAKEIAGWATKRIKSRAYDVDEVRRMLKEAEATSQGGAKGTELCVLASGECRRLVG